MFTKQKLPTLLLIFGLLFLQFASPASIAQGQPQQPADATTQALPGDKPTLALAPQQVNTVNSYDL